MIAVLINNSAQSPVYSPRKRQAGFTIIEMLTAMVLFAVAVTMLVSIFELIQSSQRNATYYTVATHAARSEVERLKSTGYASLTNGNTSSFVLPDTLPSGSTGTIAVAASNPTNAPNSKKVDVTVTYPTGSRTKVVTITAYIDPPGTN